VQYYRVFWRPVGSRDLNRNQTDQPFFEISGLDESKMYEFVVKSGNHYGLSIFTDPLVISPSALSETRTTSINMTTQVLRVVMAISFVAFIIIIVAGLVLYSFRNHIPLNYQLSRILNGQELMTSSTSSSPSSSQGVSFENPSYMKDTTPGYPTVQFRNGSNNNFTDNSGSSHGGSLMEVNANYDPSASKITLISP
jgi:hypothetical protein